MKPHYLLYPGCASESSAKAYDRSVNAVFDLLDITLNEIDDWNCCGATEYLGFSLGSGIGVEMQDRTVIFDAAYSFRYAEDTRSPLASESGLSADAIEHQFYLSAILHF